MDPKIIANLQAASTSIKLTAAAVAIPREGKYYNPEILDLILQKQHLIIDAATADAVTSFVTEFAFSVNSSVVPLRTIRFCNFIINVLAPHISGGDPVSNLAGTIWIIVQSRFAAEHYSDKKSLSAILNFCYRATQTGSAEWIGSCLNAICDKNPTAINTLVEAFSAIIPSATSADSASQILVSIKKMLKHDKSAVKSFGTPIFFDKIKSMEKYVASDTSTFFSVVEDLKSIVDVRVLIENSLRAASTSRALVIAMCAIIAQSDRWPSLIDLLVQKQYLIQDQESISTTAAFISTFFMKGQITACRLNSEEKKKIYEMFRDVLLPNSRKFVAAVSAVHDSLVAIITGDPEAQEFFCATWFMDYLVYSIPHSNKSLIKLLKVLLDSNKQAPQVFGKPQLVDQLEAKFSSNTSPEFLEVVKILNSNIVRPRFEALKKIAADLKHEIDETLLKKLADNEFEIAHLSAVDSSVLFAFGFPALEVVPLRTFIQKAIDKSSGVANHQHHPSSQELEQLRCAHDLLRGQHQTLHNALRDEQTSHAAACNDREKRIDELEKLLANEKITTSSLATSLDIIETELGAMRLDRDTHQSTANNLIQTLSVERASHDATIADRNAKELTIMNLRSTTVELHSSVGNLRQELEQLRRDHDHVLNQHQTLYNALRDEQANHAAACKDRDAKHARINELEKLLANEKAARIQLRAEQYQLNVQNAQLQIEVRDLRQDKALPSDAPRPSRCFQNVQPKSFENSLKLLCSFNTVPNNRPDIQGDDIPTQDTAARVFKEVDNNMPYLKGKPEIQNLIKNCKITDDEIKAILAFKIEQSFRVYRWLNAQLNGPRDQILATVGPFFLLLRSALQKLPKIKAKASRAVVVDGIKALRDTFDNYEVRCAKGKLMNFWGISSFSRDDQVGANGHFAGGPTDDAIIYACGELEGVDLEPFLPQGMRPEDEILPLCPTIFKVQSAVKHGQKLFISIEQCERDVQEQYSYL